MSTRTLLQELKDLADTGAIRYNPSTHTLELKAGGDSTYHTLNLLELTEPLPEGAPSTSDLDFLEKELHAYLAAVG